MKKEITCQCGTKNTFDARGDSVYFKCSLCYRYIFVTAETP